MRVGRYDLALKSLKEKYSSVIDYPFEHSSVGSLLLFGTLHDTIFGINLSEFELRRLGRVIEGRLNYGMFEIANVLNHILGKTYGIQLPDSKDPSWQTFRTSYSYMKFAADSINVAPYDLNSETLQILNCVKNDYDPTIIIETSDPIYLRLLDIEKYAKEQGIEIPLDLIAIGKKGLDSMLIKEIRKLGDIFNSDEDSIRNYLGFSETLSLSDKSLKIYREHIRNHSLGYLKKAISAPEGFYTYNYLNRGEHGDLGGDYDDDVSAGVLPDSNRGKLVGNTKEVRRISQTMFNFPVSDGNSYGLLPNKTEVMPRDPKQSWDGSPTFGICGKNIGVYMELKVQETQKYFEGEFGGSPDPKIQPHRKFNARKKQTVRRHLNESRLMRKILTYGMSMFDSRMDKVI